MGRHFDPQATPQEKLARAGPFAIVVSKYNRTVTQGLLDGAIHTLRSRGISEDQIDVFWVPGSFEIPTVAGHLARSGRYVAVLCLGAVIKGETTHDQHINRAVSLSLARLGTETGVPVLFGVLTCDTLEQALARSGPIVGTRGKDVPEGRTGNKGVECAEAALEMVALLEQLAEAGLLCERPHHWRKVGGESHASLRPRALSAPLAEAQCTANPTESARDEKGVMTSEKDQPWQDAFEG
ncbi:MAG: 6,7-dimethyl-8-ribityllumazine synthase [Thermoguttaceae bacterium]|nr:6,7-dimethyl-8-ribityllumazine synthase [Thermoguttaceae bacterium]MDW8078089.1 6,7-dimethyl-8-ribityllumazine synthase [Thermoguttaceae bacterium]